MYFRCFCVWMCSVGMKGLGLVTWEWEHFQIAQLSALSPFAGLYRVRLTSEPVIWRRCGVWQVECSIRCGDDKGEGGGVRIGVRGYGHERQRGGEEWRVSAEQSSQLWKMSFKQLKLCLKATVGHTQTVRINMNNNNKFEWYRLTCLTNNRIHRGWDVDSGC